MRTHLRCMTRLTVPVERTICTSDHPRHHCTELFRKYGRHVLELHFSSTLRLKRDHINGIMKDDNVVCCLAVILGLRESWKLDRHELIAEHATAPQAFKRPLPGSGSFVARRLFPRSRLFAGPYVHHRVVHVRAYGALDERAPRWKLVRTRPLSNLLGCARRFVAREGCWSWAMLSRGDGNTNLKCFCHLQRIFGTQQPI